MGVYIPNKGIGHERYKIGCLNTFGPKLKAFFILMGVRRLDGRESSLLNRSQSCSDFILTTSTGGIKL